MVLVRMVAINNRNVMKCLIKNKVDTMKKYIFLLYNVMKFPKAENGRYVNMTFLTNLISKIKGDTDF